MLLSEGQMSDYKGAALMLDALPPAKALLGDRGYDAGWFRNALAERGMTACIPSKANLKIPITHDRALYRQRHKIENMFGKLKDWRRIHTRYDRCVHTFFSAICIAVSSSGSINEMGWLPPSQTVSQWAKKVVLKPPSGKDGNRDEKYDDWRGSGKVCFSATRCIDDGRAEVPQEAIAAELPEVHGRAASSGSRDGGLWQRPLLGPRDDQARS